MLFIVIITITDILLCSGASNKGSSFYCDDYFNNYFCSSSATKVSGTVKTAVHCAILCRQTATCNSFFHDSISFGCYTSSTVLLSILGCVQKNGIKYYADVKQIKSGCYHYTAAEVNSGASVEDICNSYEFHKFTAGENNDFPYCLDCHCCQRKGCYNGSPYTYSNTWFYTKSGILCQRWDSQSPHQHTFNESSMFPEDARVTDAHNYCRDPNQSGELWCYTMDPDTETETCGIPRCG